MLHTFGCEGEFKTFYKSLKNWAYLYLASSPEPGILGASNQGGRSEGVLGQIGSGSAFAFTVNEISRKMTLKRKGGLLLPE